MLRKLATKLAAVRGVCGRKALPTLLASELCALLAGVLGCGEQHHSCGAARGAVRVSPHAGGCCPNMGGECTWGLLVHDVSQDQNSERPSMLTIETTLCGALSFQSTCHCMTHMSHDLYVT